MSIKEFSKYLDKLEKTASRNEMTALLAELFSKLKAGEVRPAAYLSLGKLAPAFEGVEMNIAEKLMIRILMEAYGAKEKEIQDLYRDKGDLGSAAEVLGKKNQAKNLEISQVYQQLLEIAGFEGTGSQEKKITGFANLLQKLDSLSARFVVRIPLEKLRLGFSELTLLDALSVIKAGDKSLRPQLEGAYNVSADIGRVVEVFKKQGLKGVQKIEIIPGTPVRMSAAERLPTAEKIIEKLGRAYMEPKLDGFRVQVHVFSESQITNYRLGKQKGLSFGGGKIVKIFSRNLEDTTNMFPDIVKTVRELGIGNAIFEGEAVGYDPNTGQFLPFQQTMQRKRKYGIQETVQEIPLKVFVFDLLFLDGKAVYKQPYQKRRALLLKNFPPPESDKNILATQVKKVSSAKQIEKYFDEFISEGLEGAMIKKIDAPYQAGARGFHWIKFKRAQRGELSDTIDAVLMGYYYGRGKRTEFGIGAFLIGVYSKKEERFKTLAKVGTGLTDQQWRQLKIRAEKIKVSQKPKQYELKKELKPDVWTAPEMVVEIEADEITRSPIHSAAQDKEGRGLALRFPRLRSFRDDKAPTQATSEAELITLFKNQAQRH